MRLVLATSNAGKVAEFRDALARLDAEVVSAKEMGVEDFPEETGSSYEENARVKAVHVAQQTRALALGDDSGLEVDALGGAPGLLSARFGGHSSAEARTAHLLEKLRDVPREERRARFVCCLVLAWPEGNARAFEGVCEGEVLRESTGIGGFGYDPIFYSYDLQKGFAEASREEKQRVSHRGRALHALLEWTRANKVFSAAGGQLSKFPE